MNKQIISLIAIALLSIGLAVASPVSKPTKPTRAEPGRVPTAAMWNNTIPYIYDYINTVAAVLNRVTTKGDMYGYTGAEIERFPVGTNSHILTADSASASGYKWAAATPQNPATTKGDIIYVNDSGDIVRQPIGIDGAALSVVNGVPTWVDLSAIATLPKGAVFPYSFTFNGSTDIPDGTLVCDGTNGTPNLIGLFVVGTRPNGSASPAAAGGYGAQTADAAGAGTATHTHTSSYPSGPVDVNATNTEYNGVTNVTPYGRAGSDGNVATPYHNHTITGGNFNVTTATNEPSDYSLVYLVKQ